jgi:hypothetical protein
MFCQYSGTLSGLNLEVMDCWAQVACTWNPSYAGRRDQKDHGSRPTWAISKTLSQKYPTHTHTHTQAKADGVAQVIEHLPNKCEAVSSNTSTSKRKKVTD